MFQHILQQTFFHNRVLDYLICLSIFLGGIIIIQILKNVVIKRIKTWAKKISTTIDDFLIHSIKKELLPLLYFGALYLGVRVLTLHPTLEKVINGLGLILLIFFSVRFLLAIIAYGFETHWTKKEKDIAKKNVFKGIMIVVKVIVWGLAIVIFLDNIGFDVSALIVGLGIGGIAVALAAQSILGDLFSYFTIFFDRPFEIGDFIVVGDHLGTVEHIGVKTTRVRSLGGEQLIFSNTDLTNSRVRNFKRMNKRRVVFKLGVTYETNLQQLKEIPVIITNTIKNIDDTVLDRAHFLSYGDFSLIFEVVYYVIGGDYRKYADIQQEINFKIKEEFEKRGIEFAYPTQTLYLNKGQYSSDGS